MKREAFRHPKTLDLAARLGLSSHAYAFAHISYLFNAAADIAAQGNIGKWPNGVIARSAEWTADPESFVEALTASGWLDQHPHRQVRLLIHDWPEHAERFVKSKLAREGVWFHWAYYVRGDRAWDAPNGLQLVIPDDYCTPSRHVVASVVPTIDASPPCDPTQPNPTNPNPTQPKPRRAESARVSLAGFDSWYQTYPRHVARDKAAAAYGRAVQRIEAERKCSASEAEAWLLVVTGTFAKSPAGQASDQCGDLRYVAHPSSWLNAGRFNDDPAEWNRVRSGETDDEWQLPKVAEMKK